MSWFLLLTSLGVLKSFIDLSLLVRAPGEVLVDLKVVFVSDGPCFVFSHGLREVLLFLVEKTNFDKGVCLPLECECVRED